MSKLTDFSGFKLGLPAQYQPSFATPIPTGLEAYISQLYHNSPIPGSVYPVPTLALNLRCVLPLTL